MPDWLPRHRVPTIAAALLVAVFAPGCGDDDEEESGQSATPTTAVIELTEARNGRYRFTVPESIPAGVVRLEFKNSTRRPQEAQIVGVEGDHSFQDVLRVVDSDEEGQPLPGWLRGGGGVGEIGPGQSRYATQTLGEEERKYYVFSTSSTGDDEEAPSAARRGAVAELKIEGTAEDGELPSAPAKIEAVDYSFETSGLKAGQNTVEFDNTGRELHHVIAFPYAKGATLAQVKKAFAEEEPPNGPPPVDFESAEGTAVLDGGNKQVTQLRLKEGKNALVCFISDRKGGPPHVAKGMLTEVTVPSS